MTVAATRICKGRLETLRKFGVVKTCARINEPLDSLAACAPPTDENSHGENLQLIKSTDERTNISKRCIWPLLENWDVKTFSQIVPLQISSAPELFQWLEMLTLTAHEEQLRSQPSKRQHVADANLANRHLTPLLEVLMLSCCG